jgi:small subunit ribosomal protein S16
MVKIRLTRTGTKNQAKYRIVSAQSTRARDGKFLEILGSYDPTVNPPSVILKKERYDYWISVGAQPSDAVSSLVKKL